MASSQYLYSCLDVTPTLTARFGATIKLVRLPRRTSIGKGFGVRHHLNLHQHWKSTLSIGCNPLILGCGRYIGPCRQYLRHQHPRCQQLFHGTLAKELRPLWHSGSLAILERETFHLRSPALSSQLPFRHFFVRHRHYSGYV